MQEIFSALPALLARHEDNEDVRTAVVFAIWRHVAGGGLAEHAEPLALDGTKLTIAVADRNWQRNLEQIAPEMLFRLNSKCSSRQVTFIEFVIDKTALVRSDQRSDHARLEAQALDQITEPLRIAADAITDDDLRRKFLLAA